LLHEVPDGVSQNPEAEVFFVTICCDPRGVNQLANDGVWRVIDDSLRHFEGIGQLAVKVVLAMPDHLHGLFAFPGDATMNRVMVGFKRWVASQTTVKWQRGFFDHRIRTVESGAEKAAYIRMNPVAAGLVSQPEAWPFQR